MATAKKLPTEAPAKDVTLAQKEAPPPAEKTTIIVERISVAPELITHHADHTFTLQPGSYAIHAQITNVFGNAAVKLRVLNITDNAIVAFSGSPHIIDKFPAEADKSYAIQFLSNNQWQPIQTLNPDQYTVTLTLQ